MAEKGKKKAEDFIRSREGRDLEISWYCDSDGWCWLVCLSPNTNNSLELVYVHAYRMTPGPWS